MNELIQTANKINFDITFEYEDIVFNLLDIGVLQINSSSTILTKNEFQSLKQLCEIPLSQNMELIYQASIDGFGADKFHEKCDNRANTLTIIYTQNNCIFGGFTSQTWNHSYAYKCDPNAYIFSFKNVFNKKVKLKVTNGGQDALCCYSHWGPTFGSSHDIHISNDSNENLNSYSNLTRKTYYSLALDTYRSCFLAGTTQFQVKDIEIFQFI